MFKKKIETPSVMTEDEFKQLDGLLRKLATHMGSNRFCLIPESYQDLTQIGIYNHLGNAIHTETAPSLKQCADKCRELTFKD